MMLSICCCLCFFSHLRNENLLWRNFENRYRLRCLNMPRLFPDDTSKNYCRVYERKLLIYLLLVGPFNAKRTDNEFFLCFRWAEGIFFLSLWLVSEMRHEKQDNSISHGSIIKKVPLSKQGLRQNTAGSDKTREKSFFIWIKNIFLMQTLNDLLTEALTSYNWAHYLNIQHGREEE